MRHRRKQRYTARPEINITPFVDVVLVLLLVFMITAPLLSLGVPVDLPKANSKSLPASNDPVVVSLQTSGEIYLQDTPIKSVALLSVKLQALQNERPDLQVFLRAAKDLSYGDVLGLMGSLANAGIRKLTLLSRPQGK